MTTRAHALAGGLLLSLISCGGSPSRPSPLALGQQFELRLGQRAAVAGDASLVFVDVPSDSRCPIDATCVSAGEAVVNLVFGVRPANPGTPSISLTLWVNGLPIVDGKPASVPWCVGSDIRQDCALSTAPDKSSVSAHPFTIRLVDLKPHPRAAAQAVRTDYVGTFIVSGS